MEVGVGDGRFSQHFLLDGKPKTWYMVEPYPNANLRGRTHIDEKHGVIDHRAGSWALAGAGASTDLRYFQNKSLERSAFGVLKSVPRSSLDFVYLDGAHDHATVKRELFAYWPLVRPGGVLAGHDYCNHGEAPTVQCCAPVPRCRMYTEFGVLHGKPAGKIAQTQRGVASAVQEWFHAQPGAGTTLQLRHTVENFTKDSLAADRLDYALVITNTYNPSWFIVKPRDPAYAAGAQAKGKGSGGKPMGGKAKGVGAKAKGKGKGKGGGAGGQVASS
jgi:hypothetical protein